MKVKKNKKILFAALLAAIAILAIVIIVFIINRPASIRVSTQQTKDYIVPDNYTQLSQDMDRKLVSENDYLAMYLEGANSSVVIKDKKTGKFFETVPKDAINDPKASKATLTQLNAPLWLTYYNIKAQKTVVFDSYANATLLDQVYYTKLDNAEGINVKMTLGREETAMLIPEQISAAAFDELMARIESKEGARAVKKVTSLYLLYTYDTANDDQKAKYASLKDTDIYVLKSSANSRNKNELEEIYKSIGYTYEEMEAEYEALGFTSNVEAFACFRLSLNYILQDDYLKVEMNVGDIDYDKENFILTNVTVLPFFGAGMTGEEGYSFIPDGSGAIVRFNNDGAKKTLLTTSRLYGYDAAETNVDRGSQKYEYRYPVFGVKKEDTAVVGIITNGDGVATINCQVGNITHSYNTAYASFIISQNAQYESFSQEQVAWVQYDRKGYTGEIALEYHFLSNENANYAGMAGEYRDYLIRESFKGKQNLDAIPLYIDTLGTVSNNVRIMGIPDYKNVEVTSYEEAGEMLRFFDSKGIDNINLRYRAWYNGGMNNYISKNLKMEKTVGSKSSLKKLNQLATEIDAKLYMDFEIMAADMDLPYDSYIVSSDGIRNLFQKQAYYPFVDSVLMSTLSWDYCVNPTKVLSLYEDISKDYTKLGINNISLSDVGKILNSNYRKSDYINRQESEAISKELVSQVADTYDNVIIDAGNAYTYKAADTILNLPQYNSNYLIEDESVPFIQIALHGFIQYAGEPINNSSDLEKDILKSIEYGSVPYFMLCDCDGSVIKNAYLVDEKLYSVSYEDWQDKVVAAYEKISDALLPVSNACIINHEKISEGLYKTEYDNGIQIFVNYSDEEVNYDNIVIESMGYALISKEV